MERQATEQQGHGQSACTLLVKHLPEAIPFATLVRLFSHYDASSVRPCVAGRLKNCAFVDFKDESAVSRAELQLNRLRFLGKVLVVERAKPLSGVQSSESNKKESGKSSCPFTGYVSEKDINTTKPSIQSSVFVGESVAPKLGIEYPFPPHLEYAYPPPDGNILTNIVNALIAVPRFYTQVLHLMNKMNLPAPFCPALPTPPLPPQATAPSQAPEPQDLSTDESELESSSEDEMEKRKSTSGAASKPDFGNVKSSVTRKRPRVEMTATVKSASLLPKEVPTVKKRPPVLQIKINSKATPIEDIQNTEDDTENELDKSTQVDDNVVKHCATVEELEANKIPLSEILLLPMFKNYTPGNPAPILYIKNLAKDVIVDDLYYVFGSLFKDGSTTKAAVGVKLMQEGRMRGQAFVTFSSVELAEHALKMAHGFMLKGKPMIIQFGRNPSASKAS